MCLYFCDKLNKSFFIILKVKKYIYILNIKDHET